MPVLPLDCHLPTQYTTYTITLQQWTNNKTNKSYKYFIYISHVNVTQTVPDISPLMPMHQDPLLVPHFMHHDDVIKWKHFPRHWPFVRGIHWSPVNSPHKGQWRGAFMFFICAWINGWVNNREAGDLRRHLAHDDVTVMYAKYIMTHTSTHTQTV